MGNSFSTTSASGSGYEGEFTTEANCVLFIQSINMDVLNDADADGDRDSGSVKQAIDSGAAKVKLRTGYVTGGDYTLTANDIVLFEGWNRILAVVEMAQKRLATSGPEVESLRTLRDEAYQEMQLWRTEREDADASDGDEDSVGDVPIGVGPSVDQYGRSLSTCPGTYWNGSDWVQG